MRAASGDNFEDRDGRTAGIETVAFLRRLYSLDVTPIRRTLLSTSLVVVFTATALGLVVGVGGAILIRSGAWTAHQRESLSGTRAAVEPASEEPATLTPSRPPRAVGPRMALPGVQRVRPEATPRTDQTVERERPRPEPRSAAVPKAPTASLGTPTPGAAVIQPPGSDKQPSSTRVDPPAAAAPTEPAPWVRRVIPAERDTSEKVEPAPDPRPGTPQVTISPWPVPSYLKRRPPPQAPAPPSQPGPARGPVPQGEPSSGGGASRMGMSEPGESRGSRADAPGGEQSRPD
jgi:hypothetical protein